MLFHARDDLRACDLKFLQQLNASYAFAWHMADTSVEAQVAAIADRIAGEPAAFDARAEAAAIIGSTSTQRVSEVFTEPCGAGHAGMA